MRKPRRRVLVLHEDQVLTGHIKKAGALEGWEITRLVDWDDLSASVQAVPASALIVVDPYYGEGIRGGPSIELSALLNRFPSLTVAAALAVRSGRLDDLRRLGEWGVVQIIDLDEEVTSRAIAYRLAAARGRPLISLIERVLPTYTGGAARSLLRAASQVVLDGGRGEELARALHVTPRTLLRWCRKAGLPPPRRLLAWMRMLLSAELLDDPGRNVTDVALACGYSSDGSLRNALRSFLGRSPTDLRERGAFRITADEFVVELREARSPATRYRTPSGQGNATEEQQR